MTETLSPNVAAADVPDMVHGIRADPVHWIDVWNFSLVGTRSASEMVAEIEAWPSLRDLPLGALRHDPHAWPATCLSPLAMVTLQAAMIRAGMQVGMGVPPFETKWHTDDDVARILRAAERELFLEEARRRVAPHASSRLSCIWAAEDTLEGRNWVQRMMGVASFTFPVSILVAVRVSRCDARWCIRLGRGSTCPSRSSRPHERLDGPRRHQRPTPTPARTKTRRMNRPVNNRRWHPATRQRISIKALA